MNKLRLSIMCILFGFMTNSFSMSGGDITLTKMYATMLKNYKLAKESLETYKESAATLNEIRETSVSLYQEYKFVEEFSLDDELSRVQRDINGLTDLDTFNSLDTEGKFKLLNKELKRRVMTKKEEQLYRARIAELERLEELKKAKLKDAVNTSGMNQKNLDASNASSNAIQAALAVMEKEERDKEKLRQQVQASQQLEYEKDFFKLMKEESKKD